MGTAKYKELGITYRLEGIPAATKDIAAKATKTVVEGIKAYRRHWWVTLCLKKEMTVPTEEVTAKYVPAAAVIRMSRALSGFIGRKARLGGYVSLM